MTKPRRARPLPSRTRVAAYALCIDDAERMLLVRIAAGYPGAGRWTLPGGGLGFGEDPRDGVLRELGEETGLEGRIDGLAFVHSGSGPARPEAGAGAWHAIRIIYRVRISGGQLRDEADESTDQAAWIARPELSALPTVEMVDAALAELGWI